MAWSTSNRRASLPPGWDRLRLVVLARDHHECQHVRAGTGKPCLAYANQCDHIDRKGTDDLSNLQALCSYHHGVKSSREGGRARAAAAGTTTPAPHPGIRQG